MKMKITKYDILYVQARTRVNNSKRFMNFFEMLFKSVHVLIIIVIYRRVRFGFEKQICINYKSTFLLFLFLYPICLK